MSANNYGKVVVVGSINQDLTTYASSLPQPGETLLGTDFVTSPGGKGSNQAVAAASIGIVQRGGVYMIGRVGNDDMGKSLLQGLKSSGVRIGDDESCVTTGDSHTGVASIVVDVASG
jgi:ribokinase